MASVGIDQGVNLKTLRALQRRGIIVLHQANELEQTWQRFVNQQQKGFMSGNSRLGGPDVLPDDKVKEVEAIVGRDSLKDVAHVYASYLNGNEYFVTENVKDFIEHGRRERLETLLGVKIRTTAELVAELRDEQLEIDEGGHRTLPGPDPDVEL